jgi:hypothetical protein
MEQKAFNKHRVLTRKEPHLNPLAFFNANIMLMREYFPNVTFYNFKTKNIDMLRLRRGLLYGCFPFQFTFITKKETQLDKSIGIVQPSRTITPSHYLLGGTPEHPQHNK